jgi:lipoyl(octanoyl) transferase
MVDWRYLEGLVPYSEALSLMEDEVNLRILRDSKRNEVVFAMEHQEVFTAGTGALKEEVSDKNINVVEAGRGGKVTYHGPGQLIIYPVLDLSIANRNKDLKLYVSNLEQVIINSLANIGIHAFVMKEHIGVWVNISSSQKAKIAAIGIRCKKWVTYHGVAVNICNNLDAYDKIIPCGISNFPVTSIDKMGCNVAIKEFYSIFQKEFEKIFCYEKY